MMGGGPDKEHLLIIFDYERPDAILENLKRRFPYVEITYLQTKGGTGDATKTSKFDADVDLPALYKSATILCTLSDLPKKPEDAPNLKFIQLFSAGVDRFAKHPIYTDSDIPFTTVSGIHGPPISEWVLGTCLTFSKHLYIMHDWQREHQYGGPSGPAGRRALGGTTDWVGKRIGIAGYGSIGRQIARVFVAMGSEVVAYTASPRSTPESRRDKGYIVPGTGDAEGQYPTAWFSGTSKESLSTFLRSGLDALVISLPLTPSTEHLFGKAEFEVIKSAHPKGTFLINISRGKIVNQPDLIAALNDDTLKGAALDVTTPEPLPKDDPLWDAKNCIVTPHISALGTEYMTRAYDVLMTNLERLGKGEGLVNEVNRRRGY